MLHYEIAHKVHSRLHSIDKKWNNSKNNRNKEYLKQLKDIVLFLDLRDFNDEDNLIYHANFFRKYLIVYHELGYINYKTNFKNKIKKDWNSYKRQVEYNNHQSKLKLNILRHKENLKQDDLRAEKLLKKHINKFINKWTYLKDNFITSRTNTMLMQRKQRGCFNGLRNHTSNTERELG